MSELLKRKSRKSKSKYKKFDRENKFRKQAQVALKVPSIEKARRASSPKFPAKSKGDSLAKSIGTIVDAFGKKKKIPGLDNKMFKSGSIKKKIKKKKSKAKKRSALRGYGAALRGF